jgi:diguanylate cyclase (GGDEF)-like protein
MAPLEQPKAAVPGPKTAHARILVVDDEPDLLRGIETKLRGRGFETLSASNGEEALRRGLQDGPDLVLLDVGLPGLNGMEVCQRLKSELQTFVPVVLMTGRGDLENKLKGFRHGADDFLTKPFEMEELLARVNSMLRIKQLHDDMRTLSVTDALTGVYNRRYLQARLAEECQRALRYGAGFSCLMVDLDHFKELNDTHGHPFGDEALKQVVGRVQKLIRKVDILARYGGEEFVLILPGTSLADARSLAERIRLAVQQAPVVQDGTSAPLTCSVGACPFPTDKIRDMEDLIVHLDAAMYHAKRGGRNRVYALGE